MLHLRPVKQETASITNPALPVPIAAIDPLEVRIEAYLDDVEAFMTALPPRERADRRCELRLHIVALRNALEEVGDMPEIAVTEALRRFGDPKIIAGRFNRAWKQTIEQAASPWPAMRSGLFWFGMGFSAFLSGSLLAAHCGHPLWMQTRWVFWSLVVVPCVLGSLLGAHVPRRAGMGAFYALTALILGSLPLIALAPSSLALSLAIPTGGLFACWIPLGSLTATAASCIVRAYQARWRFRTN